MLAQVGSTSAALVERPAAIRLDRPRDRRRGRRLCRPGSSATDGHLSLASGTGRSADGDPRRDAVGPIGRVTARRYVERGHDPRRVRRDGSLPVRRASGRSSPIRASRRRAAEWPQALESERVDGPVRVDAFEAGIWQDGWMEGRARIAVRPGRRRVGRMCGCRALRTGVRTRPRPRARGRARTCSARRPGGADLHACRSVVRSVRRPAAAVRVCARRHHPDLRPGGPRSGLRRHARSWAPSSPTQTPRAHVAARGACARSGTSRASATASAA